MNENTDFRRVIPIRRKEKQTEKEYIEVRQYPDIIRKYVQIEEWWDEGPPYKQVFEWREYPCTVRRFEEKKND